MNKVIVVGNLSRDPEIRYTQSGTAVGNFSLAVSRKWTKDGQQQEETSFIDCTAFGKQAELIGQYVHKGNKLGVVGRLKQDSWQDKETGKTRSKLGVIVEEMEFLTPKSASPQQAPMQQPQAPQGQYQPDAMAQDYGSAPHPQANVAPQAPPPQQTFAQQGIQTPAQAPPPADDIPF